MHLSKSPKHHRYPISIISHTVWLYHRFNHSYRDIKEQMAYRGIIIGLVCGWGQKLGFGIFE